MRQLKYCLLIISLAASCLLCNAKGDAEALPTVNPQMIVETESGSEETTEYTGSAPIKAHFTSNAENTGNYTALYEWHVYEAGKDQSPYIVRHDADMDLTFTKTGTSYISLYTSFVLGTDTVLYETETPFSITVYESTLNVPNAFTPNGDGFNDVFKVKDGYRSIVKFHGYIFNRWGKKLFEWTDITQGWDGKFHGNDVADGVYFCRIEAEGADGRKYNIKKAINLIRKYTEE